MTDYLTAFRLPAAARQLGADIHALKERLPASGEWRIMEVCGTHTMAIARFGIRELLPDGIDLVSGPGCPVCVTDPGYIDAAIALAERGVIIATFGDMLYVPGSDSTLAAARTAGADIETCYSPLKALELAEAHPDREVVFLAIGFETTIAPVVSLVKRAEQKQVRNVSLLTAFKTIPPALHVLADDPALGVTAFLCPAHVSAIIGADAYQPIVRKRQLPCVIAGFEPLDILCGVRSILQQWVDGRSEVENEYDRVVTAGGNAKAREVIDTFLEPCTAHWRGIGALPGSGMAFRKNWTRYSAEQRFGIEVQPGRIPPGCRCGEVIKGALHPKSCPLFGTACRPDRAVGPCMVSAEGSCAAAYKYQRWETDDDG